MYGRKESGPGMNLLDCSKDYALPYTLYYSPPYYTTLHYTPPYYTTLGIFNVGLKLQTPT